MIKALRKKHLQVWTAWAFLLPVGIIAAWMVIPQQAKDKLLQPAATEALPVLLLSKNKENYTINIRSNSDTAQLQLEWINKSTLIFPTATVYYTTARNDIAKGKLIGRIEARGTYRFVLDSTFRVKDFSNHDLLLYDFIHQKIIDRIRF